MRLPQALIHPIQEFKRLQRRAFNDLLPAAGAPDSLPVFGGPAAYSGGGRDGYGGKLTDPSIAIGGSGGVGGYASYEQYYRQQPFLKCCIDFLARNVAQLPLHVYKRMPDDSRIRLRDHPLSKLLADPNQDTDDTYYDFINDTLIDFLIYGVAYWLKVRDPQHFDRLSLWRISPKYVGVEGALKTVRYQVLVNGKTEFVYPRDVVRFSLYEGISPIESLRPLLDEEYSAAKYRNWFWSNAARMSGIVERPVNAPRWTAEQKGSWINDWRAFYSGIGNAGRTALLEDGMQYKELSYSAQESQLDEARRYVRDLIASAYHIPPPMVGILDNATYANIREQHRMLYQDCLGPTLAMIEQRIQTDLLPEFSNTDGLYVEFNVAEKMQGSFEEQAAALASLCGSPVLAVNEGRARLNLPRADNEVYDVPIVPLNVTTPANMPGGNSAAFTPTASEEIH